MEVLLTCCIEQLPFFFHAKFQKVVKKMESECKIMVDEWEDGWMNEWLNGYIYFTDHMPACIIICFGKI